MAKKLAVPTVSIQHNDVEPPKYSDAELRGLMQEAMRLEKHIDILLEEARNKRSQLDGIRKIIKENKK